MRTFFLLLSVLQPYPLDDSIGIHNDFDIILKLSQYFFFSVEFFLLFPFFPPSLTSSYLYLKTSFKCYWSSFLGTYDEAGTEKGRGETKGSCLVK